MCPKCNYACITKRNLDRHIINNHVREGQRRGPRYRRSRYRDVDPHHEQVKHFSTFTAGKYFTFELLFELKSLISIYVRIKFQYLMGMVEGSDQEEDGNEDEFNDEEFMLMEGDMENDAQINSASQVCIVFD